MKGLLVKDLALMKQRWKTVIFLLIWGIVMLFVMEDPAFTVGWVTTIAVITSISTISYDEYDNGMPFLMSLPISRRSYALEKYVFSILSGAAAWMVSLILVIAVSLIARKGFSPAEDIPGMLMMLAVIPVVPAVTIPPQLKWGAEKGRTVMLILFGVMFAGGYFISRFVPSSDLSAAGPDPVQLPAVIAVTLALSLILTAISGFLSVRIMEKKEF